MSTPPSAPLQNYQPLSPPKCCHSPAVRTLCLLGLVALNRQLHLQRQQASCQAPGEQGPPPQPTVLSENSLHHFPFSCSLHSPVPAYTLSFSPSAKEGPLARLSSQAPHFLKNWPAPHSSAAPSLTPRVTKSGFHFLMTFPLTSFGPNHQALIGFLASALGG